VSDLEAAQSRSLGEQLRHLRIEAGMSQAELADRAGVGQSYLAGVENGKRNPTLYTLWRLAIALGRTPRSLF